jgi:chemotaxis response regulator CheB
MKRVIVLDKKALFWNGLESLLSQETDIEMVTWDRKLSDVVKCIQENNPDALIINCDDPTQDVTPAILCALREKFDMVIIGLSQNNNQVTVYRGEQKQILQIDDLLNVIRN